MSEILMRTDFSELIIKHRGKVRDMYEIPGHPDKLLMVATDRISAGDVIMDEGIPGKGKVLTYLSLFWLNLLGGIIKNHLITANVYDYPKECLPYFEELQGRSMLVKKTNPLPIECIVRGHISGSFWSAYKEAKLCLCCGVPYKMLHGFRLPGNMLESEKFSETLFTPSTKADIGSHDENISLEQAGEIVGASTAHQVNNICLKLYQKAAEYALSKGIIIADTKFELGELDGKLILIDEVLTPDSSRFWPLDKYEPGKSQPSFDKQFLRDYLSKLGWDKNPPPPSLPSEIIEATRIKYVDALWRIAFA
jgi:phosphoribosylaminoimidazole-succinocarboxamide synthase